MTQEKTKGELWLEKKYPHGVELTYIDYRDSIEDDRLREEVLQNYGNAYEILKCDYWIPDNESESIDTILREYMEEIGLASKGETLDEEEEEAMSNWLYSHDTSKPIEDLLKNTPSEYLYYDTGIYIQGGNDETEKEAKMIAKKLKIDYDKNKKVLNSLLAEAYYGGQLVILFEGKIRDFIEDGKYIRFKNNYELCIMDRGQGSGSSETIDEKLLFEFVRENIHTDEGDNGYSFSGDVCGLIHGIMEDGEITNKKKLNEKIIRVKTNEERKAQREKERQYEENWKKGKCSFGDMNMKRHKNTPYRNEYPCGNKCEECGTFWID